MKKIPTKQNIQQVVHALQDSIFYQSFIGILALLSAGMLLYEFFGKNISAETLTLMSNLDLTIAYIFLTDFSVGVLFASHKLHHIKTNWFDLVGSVPLSDGLFRALRIARFVRLVRLLRVINTGQNVESSAKEFYDMKKNGH